MKKEAVTRIRKGKKEKLKRKQSQLYGRKKGKMDKASKGSEGKAR